MAAMTNAARSRRLPPILLALTLGLAVHAHTAHAQLWPPDGITVQAGCQQYVLQWVPRDGAAAYRVYVEDPPETLTVTTNGAAVAVTTTPTDRVLRVATVDGSDVEGDRALVFASGADASFPDLLELPDLIVHVGEPISIMAQLANAPGIPAALDTFQWSRDGSPLNGYGSSLVVPFAQFSDSGLYTLRGCRRCCDETAIVRVIVRAAALPPPLDADSQPGCQSLVVAWTPVPGAVGYRVTRQDNNGTTYPPVDVVAPPYEDGAAPAIPRQYRVSSVDQFGKVGFEGSPTLLRGPGPGPLGSFGVGPDRTVVTGTNVSLDVQATFDGPTTTYQWRKNGAPIQFATSGSYFLGNAQPSASGTYDCIACNPCGCSTSAPMTLLVANQPPAPASVTATAACSSAVVTWTPVAGVTQYRVDRSPGFTGPPPSPPGPIFRVVTGTSLADDDFFPPPNPTDVRYTVRSMGPGTILSGPRQSNPVTPERIVPNITRNPQSRTLVVGQRLTLDIDTGPHLSQGAATWQWYKNGVAIPGATQRVFTIPAVSPGDFADYHATVCTLCGCDTSSVGVVKVCAPITLTVPSGGSLVFAGEGVGVATLAVDATNATTLQWYRDGVALTDGGRVSGTSTGSLSIAAPLTEDAGFYELRAGSPCETATRTIELRVDPCYDRPTITEQPPLSLVVETGQPASLAVAATCCRPPTYEWLFRRKGTFAWLGIAGGTQPTLNIPSMSAANEGTYMCVVTNRGVSNVTDYTEVSLQALPVITFYGGVSVCGGWTYQWRSNVPVAVSARLREKNCANDPPETTPPSAYATIGSATIPLGPLDIRFVELIGTTPGGHVATTGCLVAAPRAQVAEPHASSTIGDAYATGTPVGTAVVLRISAHNNGCIPFDGTITLTRLDIAGLPAGAFRLDGSPAIPTDLPGAYIVPAGQREFPELLVPVTPPAPGVTVSHVYSGTLVYTPVDGLPTEIGFVGSFVLRPEGVTR